jgi:hypothetical protein
MKIRHRVFLALTLASIFLPRVCTGQPIPLEWKPRTDLNILLPPSVRVYEANGILADTARVRAVYATISLRDGNLKLRAVGSNSLRQTTLEAYREHDAIFAVNGGYFSSTASVSLLISDGEVIAPGPQNGLTRGAFGLVNGKPEIVWPYTTPPENVVYKYLNPNEPAAGQTSFALPKTARQWQASQAVGAGPVLIKDGKIRDTSKEEGFGGSHLNRHPRTAIGYLNDSVVVMMVVDGRQKTSAGVTIKELARLMYDIGCYEAVNLDGGGSSAMIAAGEVVNIPVDVPNGNRNSLRKNASAVVVTEAKRSVTKEVFYIDTDSKHYRETGLWRSTNHVNYYGKTPSRTSSANGENQSFYSLDTIQHGLYQLALWWTVNEDSNTDRACYVLHRNGKTDTLYADQRALSSTGKWNVMGNFKLGPKDYLELTSKGSRGKLVADAIRLVALEKFPPLPARGDVRIAVISDLNSALGSANYEWQVDSLIHRIPRLWNVDLTICGGDMVAGMGVSDTTSLKKMWAGFDRHISAPLRQAGIPFAFTIGNHDGPRSYAVERQATARYWSQREHDPGLTFVDRTHFPHYYSFLQDQVFIVSWDASSSDITPENLRWMEQQFERPEAVGAKFRFVMGHIPLYSVAQERDSKGNFLDNADHLQRLLEKHNVHTYISGHQHAYYPGKHGGLQLLNAGAAGSGPRRWLTLEADPINTVTIMDVFYDQDTIVYSTYNIKQKQASDMALVDVGKLPGSIFGSNGYVIRNDIKIHSRASGAFHPVSAPARRTGEAQVIIKANTLHLAGHFEHLDSKLVNNPEAIALYKGRNTEEGELILKANVKSGTKKTGTFKGQLECTGEMAELLSSGALYVLIKTEGHPEGALRCQLYPATNSAPSPVVISSHPERNVYAVRNILALYPISWNKSHDQDGDLLTYTYQLAADADFNNILLQKNARRMTHVKEPEKVWYDLAATSDTKKPITLYHRVVTSDGQHATPGPFSKLQLRKSDEPLEDFIEVTAPDYVSKGRIENAKGAGSGALWDKQGKLWLADYGGTLFIKRKDGTDAPFSPLSSVNLKGETYRLKPINGIGIDLDGNILIASNRQLIKVDASTGEGIATWTVPEGKRAITSPRVNVKGEIYLMSLFPEDPNYVLKQHVPDPTTFDVVRTITLKDRILARTFDMSPDGLSLYFPDPGTALIQKYNSKDGITYRRDEDISSTAAGSNAIRVTEHGIYTAVRSSGEGPSTIHFRDDVKKLMWTLPLPEMNGAEARGIAVSEDGTTIIFCSWDGDGGFYWIER